MNRHLSSRRISQYVSGGAKAEDIRHVRECAACQEEVARLESSLRAFRGFVREWSGEVSMRQKVERTPMTAITESAEHHLEGFVASAWCDTPWHRSLLENLRELISPRRLPDLQVTSQPIAVNSIWGLYGRQKKSWLLSLGFQTFVVATLFGVASSPAVRQAARQAFELYTPIEIAPYRPKIQGGGGGGDKSPLPASKGKLARPALRQFTPPEAVQNNSNPKLTVEPTILAPPDVPLPQVAASNYGDPFSKWALLSNGSGSAGGIGSGVAGGVGPGSGGGVGSGSGGGIGGAIYEIGGGVSAPVLVYKMEPEYSEEARKAKYQGTVVLRIIVDRAGQVADPMIVRSLGLGLDEKAMEAVKKWRFRPGYKNGKPVPVFAEVEVSFRLL